MRSRHVAMSREEFDLLPLELGWKSEFSNGVAHFSPADHIAFASVPVTLRRFQSPLPLRPVTIEDQPALTDCFISAFRDTIEFCDSDHAKTTRSAKKLLRDFFDDKRGKHLDASVLAHDSRADNPEPLVAGAALLLDHKDDSAMLDLLFVNPDYRNRGIATALAGAAISELHRYGKQRLISRYHLGNSESRNWHAHFGFVEEPDLILARLYLAAAQQEYLRARRLEKQDTLKHQRLMDMCNHWTERVEALEAVARKEGMEGAFAAWRHRH